MNKTNDEQVRGSVLVCIRANVQRCKGAWVSTQTAHMLVHAGTGASACTCSYIDTWICVHIKESSHQPGDGPCCFPCAARHAEGVHVVLAVHGDP